MLTDQARVYLIQAQRDRGGQGRVVTELMQTFGPPSLPGQVTYSSATTTAVHVVDDGNQLRCLSSEHFVLQEMTGGAQSV